MKTLIELKYKLDCASKWIARSRTSLGLNLTFIKELSINTTKLTFSDCISRNAFLNKEAELFRPEMLRTLSDLLM